MMTIVPSDQRATHAYYDNRFNCPSVKVLPGEYFIGAGDLLLMTVLGSCVSACIYDPQAGLGGMNHFMLPESAGGDQVTSYSMRYGACAMEVLINELLKAGARRSRLQAKVFGGGSVMGEHTVIDIGGRNSRFVEEYLATESIPITATDLGHDWGRKVLFFPGTGRAMVKKVHIESTRALARKESDYARQLRSTDQSAGAVELF